LRVFARAKITHDGKDKVCRSGTTHLGRCLQGFVGLQCVVRYQKSSAKQKCREYTVLNGVSDDCRHELCQIGNPFVNTMFCWFS
jgi:hypothetical protein